MLLYISSTGVQAMFVSPQLKQWAIAQLVLPPLTVHNRGLDLN